MSRRGIETTCAAALCLMLGVTGCHSMSKEAAPAPPPAPAAAAPLPSRTVGENLVSATAVVKAIDQKTRHVTLQQANGKLIKFVAGNEVRNLAQVKVGDEVTVSYYESLAYAVKKPGGDAPVAAVAEGVGRAKLGEKPGGAGVRAVTMTATIAAIDTAAGTVTLRGPEGDTKTIKARYPDDLKRVSVGDLVEITYTEALAISVQTPTKK
jgi:Cu/Ag efflux protein CusF